jgi:hypothetical protein
VRDSIATYQATLAGYMALGKYLGLVLLFLVALLGQMASTKQAASIGATIGDALFDASTQTIETASGNVVSDFQDTGMLCVVALRRPSWWLSPPPCCCGWSCRRCYSRGRTAPP